MTLHPSSSASTTPPSQSILVFDTSSTHLTRASSEWWASFNRRARALYSPPSPSSPRIGFSVILAPPPATHSDLATYARFLHEEIHLTWRCFAVISDESASTDAVEMVVLLPQSQCIHVGWCGQRFVLDWAQEFHAEPGRIDHVYTDANTVSDTAGIARRLTIEQEVRAHKSEEWKWTKQPKCHCEWHAPTPF